jgi:hypothetical protein
MSVLPIDILQPSQLYIHEDKLRQMRATGQAWDPIPVKQLGPHLIMTDGHTRAFSAWSSGQETIAVVWDEDDLDWGAYEICVRWCQEENIRTIRDLHDRVVDAETYQRLWLDRCAQMHRELEHKRG